MAAYLPMVVDIPVGPTNLHQIPVVALGARTRSLLALHLNPDRELAANWRLLAEELDYEYLQIEHFAQKQNPTAELLKEWGSKRNHTVGFLLEKLQEIERDDVVSIVENRFVQDAQKWLRKRREEEMNRVQVHEVHSSGHLNETRGITVGDDPKGPVELFDAYVCFSQEDLGFVEKMIEVLEGQYNLKLCISSRDQIPGGSHNTITAELIENRCRRMVVVLSPEFLNDGFCDFAVKFGVSLQPGARSKKVIPLIAAPCEIPSIMRHLTTCDYTKKCLRQWFWNRLYCAIKAPL